MREKIKSETPLPRVRFCKVSTPSIDIKLDKKVLEQIEEVHKQNPNPSP